MPNQWQMIPDDVLDAEDTQQSAEAWAQKKRLELAQEWGALKRQEFAAQLASMPPMHDETAWVAPKATGAIQAPSPPAADEGAGGAVGRAGPSPADEDSGSGPDLLLDKAFREQREAPIKPEAWAESAVRDESSSGDHSGEPPSAIAEKALGAMPPEAGGQSTSGGPQVDLPPLTFAGAPMFFQPSKPVPTDEETRRKMLANEPLTAEDFARYATKAIGEQYSTLPTSAEAMLGHGFRIGEPEGSLAARARLGQEIGSAGGGGGISAELGGVARAAEGGAGTAGGGGLSVDPAAAMQDQIERAQQSRANIERLAGRAGRTERASLLSQSREIGQQITRMQAQADALRAAGPAAPAPAEVAKPAVAAAPRPEAAPAAIESAPAAGAETPLEAQLRASIEQLQAQRAGVASAVPEGAANIEELRAQLRRQIGEARAGTGPAAPAQAPFEQSAADQLRTAAAPASPAEAAATAEAWDRLLAEPRSAGAASERPALAELHGESLPEAGPPGKPMLTGVERGGPPGEPPVRTPIGEPPAGEPPGGPPASPAGQPQPWAGIQGAKPVRDLNGWIRDTGLGNLANPASVAGIVIKNAWEIPTRLLYGVAGSTARGQFHEIPGQVAATFDYLRSYLPRFWSGVSAPLGEPPVESGYRGIQVQHNAPILGGLANVSKQAVRPHIGITTASNLGAQDQELRRIASIMATETRMPDGSRPSLADWHTIRDSIESQVKDARDELHERAIVERRTGPGVDIGEPPDIPDDIRAIVAHISAAGERSSLTAPLGPVASLFASKPSQIPVFGPLLLQYPHIPTNAAKMMAEAHPLGIVHTLIDLATGRYGAPGEWGAQMENMPGTIRPRGLTPLGERVNRFAIGGVAGVLTGYYMAGQGLVTGSEPNEQTGMDAHRVLVGGYAVPTYLLGQYFPGLELGADLFNDQQRGKPAGATTVRGIANFIKEWPAGRVADDLYAALFGEDVITRRSDPTAWERYVQGKVEQFTPFGGALRAAGNATDPYLRQMRSGNLGQDVVQAEQAITPGWRESLPQRTQYGTGEPIRNPSQGLGALNPLAAAQRKPDPTVAMLDRYDLRPPPEHYLNRLDGTHVDFTPEEQGEIKRKGIAQLSDLIARLTPRFHDAPYEVQRQTLQKMMHDSYHGVAAEIADRRAGVGVTKRPTPQPMPMFERAATATATAGR